MGALFVIFVFLACVLGIPWAMLAHRDRKLRRKGKTEEQVMAVSKAAISDSRTTRLGFSGLVLTLSGIWQVYSAATGERTVNQFGGVEPRTFPTAALVFIPLGLLLLWLALKNNRKTRALQRFANADLKSAASEPAIMAASSPEVLKAMRQGR
jgi:hypothetical protein